MTQSLPLRLLSASVLTGLLATASLPAHAFNILITNDDGVTANLKALKTALVAAGHDVIVSVPCTNQSGKGASINFVRPITELTAACRGNAAPAGAPGIGPVDAATGLTDAYYVDGTPVMALLHGLDVLAPARWGKAPDLVISGPNEGQNVGSIVITSGTVSNAQYAIHRGVPALAVSADSNTTNNSTLAAEVAALTVNLVGKLEHRPGKKKSLVLPAGYALNVNYPRFNAGESNLLPWSITRFGDVDQYDIRFVSNLVGGYPGVTVGLAGVSTTKTDNRSEALAIQNGKIALTPMQFGYEVSPVEGQLLGLYLKGALKR